VLENLSEGKIQANGPGEGVVAFLKGGDAMVDEPGGSSPDNDVATLEGEAANGIGPAVAAPLEDGGKAEGDGDDGGVRIFLITVLMESKFGAGRITVYETGIGTVVGETGF